MSAAGGCAARGLIIMALMNSAADAKPAAAAQAPTGEDWGVAYCRTSAAVAPSAGPTTVTSSLNYPAWTPGESDSEVESERRRKVRTECTRPITGPAGSESRRVRISLRVTEPERTAAASPAVWAVGPPGPAVGT